MFVEVTQSEDQELMLLNTDQIVSVIGTRGSVTIRLRDGAVYHVMETVAEIQKRLQVAAQLPI